MLELVQAKGDASVRLILESMTKIYEVEFRNDDSRDLYQAALIHLRFSKMCTPSVKANFENMLNKSPFIGLKSLKAILYCRRVKLIAQLAADGRVNLSWVDNCTFLDKLWQLKCLELVPFFAKGIVNGPRGAAFVKSLILRCELPEYISMFTSVLKGPGEQYNHCSHCFCASKAILRKLSSGVKLAPSSINCLVRANGYRHDSKQV